MAYCLQDGTALTQNDLSNQPTLVIPPPDSIKTQVLSAPPQRQGVSPVFAYLTVALLALIVGGGVVWFLFAGKKGEEDKFATVEVGNTGSPTPVKTSTTNDIRQIPRYESTPAAEPPPLTPELINALMDAWEDAQDKRNFNAYKNCYDPSFRGVKRTVSGEVQQYNYAEWMEDRRKMMAGSFMEVGVDNVDVSLTSAGAEVKFNQFFRVPNYADSGQKVMTIRSTANGPKIFYEEMKSAALVTK